MSTFSKIICLESSAFKAMVGEIVTQIKQEIDVPDPLWIDQEEAMELLRIDSKTTFKKYREMGVIVESKMSGKHILYKRQSVLDFIEKHVS